jgi:hypothetical protein
MFFSSFTPITEVMHRGVPLLMCIDTGSETTVLHPSFLRRYRGEIQPRSRQRKALLRGVGGVRLVKFRLLSEFDFRAGGRDVSLRRVAVQTEATNLLSYRFSGTLGLDFLSECSRLTLNFESMSFVLE